MVSNTLFGAKVGSSTNAIAKSAGQEAAAKASEGLTSVKVAFVYSSVDYNQSELLEGITDELPGVALVGNTSFTGVITPDGYITSDHGFVGVMALSDEDLVVGVAGSAKEYDARATGKKVALEALKAAGREDAPSYFYMVASPGEEESYLKGIAEVIGRVPFFGGSAADNSISGAWSILCGDTSFADGVAVAFFYTDKKMANQFTGAYTETDHVGVITKVSGKRTLLEIDGVPAVEKYKQWTGQELDSLLGGNLLVTTITAPLGVKDRLGDLIAIRHPMNGNEDLSMNIGNDLAVGTAIMQMDGSVDQLISSVGDNLEVLKNKADGSIGAMHLVHCGGRRAGIGDRIEEVVSQIKANVGETPFICEFTFGEYGFEDDDKNTCGGLMLSFTSFGN